MSTTEKATEDRLLFTTRNGHVLRLKPVSPLLVQEVQDAAEAELRAKKIRLDAPTYSVKSVDGSETEYAHVIDKPKGVDTVHVGTPEEQAANEKAWNEYQAGQRLLLVARSERLSRVLYGEGVDLSEDPAYVSGEWERRLRYYGSRVPDTEPERTVFYVSSVCVTTADETAELITRLTLLASAGTVDEERVERAMALFRSGAERRAAESAAGPGGAGAVDAHAASGGDADGEDVGADA